MSKLSNWISIVFCTSILLVACQKSADNNNGGVAVGILKKSITGDCLPIVINGVYKVDTALNNDFYVDVQVEATIGGTFNIKTDTVNGFSFSKTGRIGNGLNVIRMYGSGKPLTAGINKFIVKYGTSTCNFDITVYLSQVGSALFTLGGSPGNCAVSSINGNYVVGQPMTVSNSIEMTVNVTTLGTYSISTTTVNGIVFSASGTFINLGVQSVFLQASGSALAAGNFIFPLANGINACTLIVPCSNSGPVANLDYIPQSNNSNWSYREKGGGIGDTTYTKVLPNNIIISGNNYKIFESNYGAGIKDSFYTRKNGGKYYFIFDDNYGFDNAFFKDDLLLDSTIPSGSSWIINLGNNTWGGIPATGSIKATILARGATATIASISFINIIKVEFIYRYNTGAGDVAYDRWESWYAKGIGQVYSKSSDIPITSIYEDEIIRYQVF